MSKAPKTVSETPNPTPAPLPHAGGSYVLIDGVLQRQNDNLNAPDKEA